MFYVEVGKFWNEDLGIKVESRFWFGDSYLVFYGEDIDVRKIGFVFSILFLL